MGSSCIRFLPLSNLRISSPKDCLNQGLNISERSWWDGNSLLHWCLRGSVDGHFGCYLFFFDLHEKGNKCNHQSSQQMVRGTFQDCFISILYVTASIPTCETPGFVWKLKIWRSKRFDWRSWTHTSCSLIYFGSLSPLSPGKAQFISQIVKIAHRIQNCVCITSISSFHYFISF